MTSLARLDGAIRSAGVPIHGISGGQGSVRVDYKASATAPQRAQGDSIVAAFDWSVAADATWVAQQAKAAAASAFDNGELQGGSDAQRALIALTLLILDEFNLHTTLEASLFSAIAAATSLADLKTRVGAVQAIPSRTKQQLINAIKAKISATAE